MKWQDMLDAQDEFENNVAYIEKLSVDADEIFGDINVSRVSRNRKKKARDACAWVKKRNFKKKMVRRFLSINPDMDYSKKHGMSCRPAIYICEPSYEEGEFFDPRMEYVFNPYTRVFLSRRGDLRKYHGETFFSRQSFSLGVKNKDMAKITNRRIRHDAIIDETGTNYTYLKKLYSPVIDFS